MNLLAFPNLVWQDQRTIWLTLILQQNLHLQKHNFSTYSAQAHRVLPFALTNLDTTKEMTRGRCSIWWFPRTITMHTLCMVTCVCYCTFQSVVDVLRSSSGWRRQKPRLGRPFVSQCKCFTMHELIVPDCPVDGHHPRLKLVLAHCIVCLKSMHAPPVLAVGGFAFLAILHPSS